MAHEFLHGTKNKFLTNIQNSLEKKTFKKPNKQTSKENHKKKR
jgi:hypothetical protein